MYFQSLRLPADLHLVNLLPALDRNDTHPTSSETAHPCLFQPARAKRHDIDGSRAYRDLFYFFFCAGIHYRDAV